MSVTLKGFSPYSISVTIRLLEFALLFAWAFILWSPANPLDLSFDNFALILSLSAPAVLLWTLIVHPLGRCRNCGKSPLHSSEPLQEWIYIKSPWRSIMRQWKFWPDDECEDCRAELTSVVQTHD